MAEKQNGAFEKAGAARAVREVPLVPFELLCRAWKGSVMNRESRIHRKTTKVTYKVACHHGIYIRYDTLIDFFHSSANIANSSLLIRLEHSITN